jgi:hypothetical protein
MLTRFMVLLVAGAALSGCCASGTGCATATTPGTPIAWDGLGEAPTANDEPGQEKRPQKRKTARNREIILGPLNGAPPKSTSAETSVGSDAKARYDEWTRQPNEDVETDARLARQTKICKGC